MRYFSHALRSEMKLYNVNVTCLIPGATETGLYDPNRVNLTLAKELGVMQTADVVAKKGIDAMFKNKAECIPGWLNKLDFSNLTGTYCSTTFTDSETKTFLHRDWINQVLQ
jgi:short-subunit dehydrogenase